MSPWIDTDTLQRGALASSQNMQAYCGLDGMVTKEVLRELRLVCGAQGAPAIYDFERALQAPYLEMMQRGWAVDEGARRSVAASLRERMIHIEGVFHEFTVAIKDHPVNYNSPKQLQALFYDSMRLPKQIIRQKGQSKVSTNREALEKLDAYLYARPLVACILKLRELKKQLDVFEMDVRAGRIHTSFNIAGTETGRPSSSTDAFGDGGNVQNIALVLRYAFVADAGKKLCQIDLEQVEARDVGFFEGCLFDDWRFLDACEGGDLHTINAKLVWPELGWTGDKGRDRQIAEGQFYREFSFRDMAKRGSHLSNYSGTAWTMSRALKIPLKIAEEFQARYCRGAKAGDFGPSAIIPAFDHPRWWQWTAEQIQTVGWLQTPFGRKRHFFGRTDSGETLREAIAFMPQGTTADRMNLGLWRVWKYMPEVELLGQGFDSITFQYDETADEDSIIGRALELIRVELVAPNGRRYVVPGEAKIGWNWGIQVTQQDIAAAVAKGKKPPRFNPEGLIKWKPGKKDLRTRGVGLKRISGT